jgi:hypothetical protein
MERSFPLLAHALPRRGGFLSGAADDLDPATIAEQTDRPGSHS